MLEKILHALMGVRFDVQSWCTAAWVRGCFERMRYSNYCSLFC